MTCSSKSQRRTDSHQLRTTKNIEFPRGTHRLEDVLVGFVADPIP
jgi:hypothetical protein